MKHETDYAYAVARVRANEPTLLSEADVEQLITSPDYNTVMRRLSDSGWGEFKGSTDYAVYLENHAAETWNLLIELLDDIHELDFLIIRNDMQNLKAALKSIISQHKTEDFDELFVVPTVYNTDEIVKAVDERKFNELPECMQATAAEVYEILTSNGNGQLADAVIDRATLDIILKWGYRTKSQTLINIVEKTVATADIKIALRALKTGKDVAFLERSLAECKTISKKELISAVSEGRDAVLTYISNTSYEGGVEALNESTSAFEKWCDDNIMECVQTAKYSAFGIDPIVAYYVAKDSEIKSVRIILSAKLNNLPADIIRERVRLLYV